MLMYPFRSGRERRWRPNYVPALVTSGGQRSATACPATSCWEASRGGSLPKTRLNDIRTDAVVTGSRSAGIGNGGDRTIARPWRQVPGRILPKIQLNARHGGTAPDSVLIDRTSGRHATRDRGGAASAAAGCPASSQRCDPRLGRVTARGSSSWRQFSVTPPPSCNCAADHSPPKIRVQPVAAVAVVIGARALEQMTVHLNAGRVQEQRNIAPSLQLVGNNGQRNALRKPHLRAPTAFTSSTPRWASNSPAQRTSGTWRSPSRAHATYRRVAHRGRTALQHPGQGGDHGPQGLRIGGTAVADLHRDRLVKKLEKTKVAGSLGKSRCAVRFKSVNSNSSFGGRILRFVNPHLPSELFGQVIFAREP